MSLFFPKKNKNWKIKKIQKEAKSEKLVNIEEWKNMKINKKVEREKNILKNTAKDV